MPSNLGQIDRGLKNAKTLYLWTEKGAFLHAKSLNTEKAWDVYEHLIDFYFHVKELSVDKCVDKSFITHSDMELPKNPTWYGRNRRRIKEICGRMGIAQNELYHRMLVKLDETYDIENLKLLYVKDKGVMPEYTMVMINYFTELGKAADVYLDNFQKMLEYMKEL